MKKRLVTLALSLGLCLGLAVPAGAYDMGYAGERQVLTCGNSNTAFIKPDGTLWAFGSVGYLLGNTSGNLSTLFGSYQTVPVKLMDGVTSASIGLDHMAAIQADGSLWVWGNSFDGQVGNGAGYIPYTEEDYQTMVDAPVKVLDNVAAVSCGDSFTAAVRTDGTVWTWGLGDLGQLGNGECGAVSGTRTMQSRPVKVLDGARTVACGGSHAAAIKTDGSLWMWGALGSGGSVNDCQSVPVKVMDNVAAVSCGQAHTAVLKTDGSLWTFGDNTVGQLGDGTVTDRTTPVKILDNVRAVSCGSDFTAAVRADNSLWIWGSNEFSRLGNGGASNAQVSLDGLQIPVQTTPVKILDNVAGVSCGGQHGAAVLLDGSLWTWGSDLRGQLGRGATDPSLWYGGVPQASAPVKVVDSGVSLPAGITPPVPTVGGFSDVPETSYCAAGVLWAVEQGVTSGTSATTFSPEAACSTAEILTFLWRASGSPAPSGSSAAVPAGQYYTAAANWALEQGLTGSFDPAAPATRADTVTYLWKLAGQPAAQAQASFSDVSPDDPCSAAVSWAVEQGVTGGTGANRFSPHATCTRGQIVTFLYRDLAR